MLQLSPAFKLVSLTLAALLFTTVSAAPIANIDVNPSDCVKVNIPSMRSSGDRRFVVVDNDLSFKIDTSNCDPSMVNRAGPAKITLADVQQGVSAEIDALTKDRQDYTWKFQEAKTLCSTKEYYIKFESEVKEDGNQGPVANGRSDSFTISCPSSHESTTSTLTATLRTRGDDLLVDPLLPLVEKDAPSAVGSDPSVAPSIVGETAKTETPAADDKTREKEAVVSVPEDTAFSPMSTKASLEDGDPSIVSPPLSETPVFPLDAVPSTPVEGPLTVSPAAVDTAPQGSTPMDMTAANADTSAPTNNDLSKIPATVGLGAADTPFTAFETPAADAGYDPEAEAKKNEKNSISKVFFKYAGWGSAALSLVGMGAGGVVGGLVGAVVGLALGLTAAVANSLYYA